MIGWWGYAPLDAHPWVAVPGLGPELGRHSPVIPCGADLDADPIDTRWIA